MTTCNRSNLYVRYMGRFNYVEWTVSELSVEEYDEHTGNWVELYKSLHCLRHIDIFSKLKLFLEQEGYMPYNIDRSTLSDVGTRSIAFKQCRK